MIGDQIETMKNTSALTFVRPFDRGYIVNMAAQIEIWQYLFNKKMERVVPNESVLIMTNPLFTPEPILNDINEVVFEEFKFAAYTHKPSAYFSAYEFQHGNQSDILTYTIQNDNIYKTTADVTRTVTSTSSSLTCLLPCYPTALTVVDSGFSFTHAIPILDMKCCKPQVKRLNIGGKLLTNYLKELVSLRQYNMMDEYTLINRVKESCCYASNNYIYDVKCAKTSKCAVKDINNTRLLKRFVLPDYELLDQGYIKPDDEPVQANEQVCVYNHVF